MENIFDGIERPLPDIAQKNGAFIATGVHVDSLDTVSYTHLDVYKRQI